jgi:glycosyltransferase involved in cell wall biosynthesis
VREGSSPAPALAAKLFGIPLLLEVNGALLEEIEGRPIDRRLLAPLLRWQARSATRVLPVTQQLARYVQLRHGVDVRRVTIVPNGADLSRFRPALPVAAKRRQGLDEAVRYVCWVGGQAPWHALDELLQAFSGLHDQDSRLHLLLVSSGDERAVRKAVTRFGLEADVTLVSAPHDRVTDYINAADVCVAPFREIPRHHLTGLAPLKVSEYLACGRPVVASRLPGLEYIEAEGLGALYAPGNVEDLARALQLTLALNGDDWQAMSRRCRIYAETHFDWRALAARIERELWNVQGRRTNFRK